MTMLPKLTAKRSKLGREKIKPKTQVQGLSDKVPQNLVLSQGAAILLRVLQYYHLFQSLRFTSNNLEKYCIFEFNSSLPTEANNHHDKELKMWEQKCTKVILTGILSCYNMMLAKSRLYKLFLITCILIHEFDSTYEKRSEKLDFHRSTLSCMTILSLTSLRCCAMGTALKYALCVCLAKMAVTDTERYILSTSPAFGVVGDITVLPFPVSPGEAGEKGKGERMAAAYFPTVE